MAYIGNRPEQGNFRKCDAITTSATATYNLLVGGVAVNPNQNQCIVSLNGVIQSSGNSYTIASSQITFSQALTSSDVIDFILILGDTLDVGVPSDDSVGLAQLSASGSPSSSNFLRGDNSWTAVSSTTINNNADNRVITGSGTANTLEGESNLTYDGTTFQLSQASPIFKVLPTTNGNSGVVEICGRSTDGTPTENRTQIKGTPEGSTANTKMTFHVENASGVNERFSINSGGDVQAPNRFIIGDDGDGSYGLNIVRGGNAGENGVYFNDKDGQTSYEFFTFRRQGTQIGHIRRDGTNDSINYTTSSDYRLKDGIVDKTDGIEKLKQLKPKKFYWKSNADKTLVDGFLAHEVSSIVPESISGEKDAMAAETRYTADDVETQGDSPSKNVGDPKTYSSTKIDPQGIDQSKLVPLLTAALKESIAKIEALEARVKTLEDA